MSLQLSLGKIFGICDGSSGVKCSATEPTTAGKPVGLGNAVTDMASHPGEAADPIPRHQLLKPFSYNA
jgi:hypothetical protein